MILNKLVVIRVHTLLPIGRNLRAQTEAYVYRALSRSLSVKAFLCPVQLRSGEITFYISLAHTVHTALEPTVGLHCRSARTSRPHF
jgi:hypothetical protein